MADKVGEKTGQKTTAGRDVYKTPEGQQAPAGADAMDPTGAGGGTMGVGMAPTPGEQGFSANNGQANIEQTEANGGQQPPVASVQ